MKVGALVLLPVVLIGLVSLAPAERQQAISHQTWRAFAGSWSASGDRQSLQTEGRAASTVYLSGALVLTTSGDISAGFRAEAIGFDDGARASLGRCVWTDARGDRIFSALTGEAIGTGRRFVGTITGGTGRYAGLTGEYSFEWEYVVEAEQGAIQGRAIGLKGRYRVSEAGR